MKELVSEAITDFDELLYMLEKIEKGKSDVGKSFRARCRELPSFIEDVGFVPALSFCYAKATKEVYVKVAKNLTEKKEKIKDEDKIKKGYAIYLYYLLKRLKALGLVRNEDPIDALKDLTEGKERIARKLIRPYIIQLKRLSEAVFEPEGERE